MVFYFDSCVKSELCSSDLLLFKFIVNLIETKSDLYIYFRGYLVAWIFHEVPFPLDISYIFDAFANCVLCSSGMEICWWLYMWMNLEVHDDIIPWKHFPHYWPFVRESTVDFVRGIQQSPVDSPTNGQHRCALLLICGRFHQWLNVEVWYLLCFSAWISCWTTAVFLMIVAAMMLIWHY